MTELLGSQRRYLRVLAHHLNPYIMVGKAGVTDAVVAAMDVALGDHELIKVRFLDFKDRKRELAEALRERTESHVVGIVGHVVIFYRQHPDEEKRSIVLPQR
jgi:RNA-binding protein